LLFGDNAIRRIDCDVGSAQTGWLNQAEPIGNQHQNKQRNRKTDAHGQRLDSSIAFAFVFHQEKQSGSETAKNQDESDGNDDFHAGLVAMSVYAASQADCFERTL
jgi:hypothetical protein